MTRTGRSSRLALAPSYRSGLVVALGACGVLCGLTGRAIAQAPPGHPPVNHPMAAAERSWMSPLPNRSAPDATLAKGTIVVEVRDERGNPLPGAEVGLVTMFASIAQGDRQNLQKSRADANGQVTFAGLDSSVRNSYGIQVQRDGATYSLAPFRLAETGHRAVVHTYPVTSSMQQAFVGIQVLSSLALRGGHFEIQAMYRVMPLNRMTFRPENLRFELPEGARAFDTGEQSDEGKVVIEDGYVALAGHFPPGQNEVAYTYQIDHENAETRVIDFGLPPHVTNLVIVVEKTPGLSLSIPGFDIQETTHENNKKIFVARKTLQAGEPPLSQLKVELRGLPTIGPGRWYASGAALLIGLGGLGLALSRSGQSREESERDRSRARRVLLDEMVLLERAFAAEEIGPRTYEQTKREILLALSRLDTPAEA